MSVEIVPVRTCAQRRAFIRLPFDFYRDDPHWVPPLLMEMRERIDPKKNPFLDHGRTAYFLARRHDMVLGRISASVDDNFVEFQQTKTGQFGFFESIRDPQVAAALIEAARNWLRDQGMERATGPLAYNGNDNDYGCLIDGFDGPPVMMYSYNPPWYADLLEGCGLTKARDVYGYRMDTTAQAPEIVHQVAEECLARPEVVVRPVNLRDWNNELDRWVEVYNEAWARNWGFSPMTPKEFRHHASLLKYVIDPELMMFAHVDGELAGAALTIPNINEVLIRNRGRLFPLGWLTMFWMIKGHRVRSCRVTTLGVKRPYRRLGIGAVFYLRTLEAGRRLGYQWGDMGWIIEDNDAMNRAIILMGGRRYRTWRVYQTDLP